MALLTEYEVRRRGQTRTASLAKSAATILSEGRRTGVSRFDIFLCHAKLDAEVVLGIKATLEDAGQIVYVDWIDDPQLDRSHITSQTANVLRGRMRQSESLFYAHSGASTKSRWMPWELGYFDGFNGNVAILPIVQGSGESTFRGEEYLGLYPYVDVTRGTLWIHRSAGSYLDVATWRRGSDKLRPAA